MGKISIKTEFILAFAALVVGLASFSSELKQVNVDLGFRNSNLWELGLISFSLLSLSIYLYALDSIRYGVVFIENWRIFKWLQKIAHAAYLFAIISPILFSLIWLFVLLLNNLPIIDVKKSVDVISLVGAFFGALVSSVIAMVQIRIKEKVQHEQVSEEASKLLLEADKLFGKKKWRLVIIEAFRLLELMFKDRAEEIGIDSSRFPFTRLVRIFVNKGLITKTQAAKLDNVRKLRNIAVHSEKTVSKQQAAYVTDVVDEIGKGLTSARFMASYFEGDVLSALGKLFPKHHIFPQFKIGKGNRVDFMAEGPGHTYFIEVKMVDSPTIIRQAFRQIQSLLKTEDRGLLVLPLIARPVDISDPRIRVVYFDLQNEKFSNQEEIYEWIYKKD